MNTIRTAVLFAACLAGTAASAQTSHPPLNLQLPPSDLPAAASTAASRPANRNPATDRYGNPVSPPGVYYGDTADVLPIPMSALWRNAAMTPPTTRCRCTAAPAWA